MGNTLKEIESKLMDLPDAVRKFIEDGSHIAMAGFAITRNAMALAHEIIRQGKRNLILSESIGDMALDLMVGAGVVKEVNYGGGSLDRLGRIDCVNRAIVEKKIKVNEYSNFSMVSRFLGGALGLTFIPTKSMIESDMFKILKDRGEATEIVCPFTGEKYVALRTLRPDVAIVHAQVADTDGNIYIYGPKFDIKEVVFASSKVLITVEEIVPKERISRDLIYIPNYRVDAIVPRPFGAYPTNLYGHYYHDEEHIRSYAKMQCEDEPFRKYLEENILGVDSFDEFLKKHVTAEKMLRLIYLAKTLV
ncbi:MAG: CoA-transferase [Thermosphaera sp.]